MIRAIYEKDYFKSSEYENRLLVKSKSFADRSMVKVIKLFKPEMDEELLKSVRLLGNSDIIRIVSAGFIYYVKDTVLPFNDMATSEKMFLIAKAAELAEVPISFMYYDRVLTDKSLKLFLDVFGKADIILVDSGLGLDLRIRQLNGEDIYKW